MRRILLGLAVLLVASLAGGAQAEQGPWQPQLTLYSGDFYSVAFASSSTVWAAGPGGIVLSEDGGASWHWASNESVLSVTAADATQGWAVGAGGTILATIDGGRTWTQQQSPTPTGLYTVGALDAQRAIAVGEGAGCDVCLPSYDGVVLVTEDGGITWRQAQLPGKYEPISLSVLAGGSNAWLSAEECIPVENGPSGCGSQDVLLASSDSGKTWEEISTQQVSEMQFTSPSTGWALDVRGLIRTKDGGKSWQRLQDFSSQGKYVSKLTLLSDRVLLLLEQDQTRPTQQIIKSTDGGTSWVPVGDESSGYLPFVLRFFDEKHAIRSGFSRPLEQTKDGGITWQAAAAPAFAFINRYNLEFDFVDPSNGWVAGTKLLRTSDAGSSWETVSDLQLNSIDFVSPTEGWAIKTVGDPVSCQIIVLHTSDGGVSWSQQATSKCLDRDTSTIRFVDKRNGWVNRGPGLPLLHTRDGGLNWSDQQPPSNSLVFVDASTVWALSSPEYFWESSGRRVPLQGWRRLLVADNANRAGRPRRYALERYRCKPCLGPLPSVLLSHRRWRGPLGAVDHERQRQPQ